MVTIISFNLTQDNCVRLLRGVAVHKGVIKNNFTVASTRDLSSLKTVSRCTSWYLVQFQTTANMQSFKEDYTEFHYEDKENPITN